MEGSQFQESDDSVLVDTLDSVYFNLNRLKRFFILCVAELAYLVESIIFEFTGVFLMLVRSWTRSSVSNRVCMCLRLGSTRTLGVICSFGHGGDVGFLRTCRWRAVFDYTEKTNPKDKKQEDGGRYDQDPCIDSE